MYFKLKKRGADQTVSRKTWDERFDELIQFKNAHGHTLVPQSVTGLGEWVHKHKKLKQGKPSPLSLERTLKLIDIDFCFDASGEKGVRQQ